MNTIGREQTRPHHRHPNTWGRLIWPKHRNSTQIPINLCNNPILSRSLSSNWLHNRTKFSVKSMHRRTKSLKSLTQTYTRLSARYSPAPRKTSKVEKRKLWEALAHLKVYCTRKPVKGSKRAIHQISPRMQFWNLKRNSYSSRLLSL